MCEDTRSAQDILNDIGKLIKDWQPVPFQRQPADQLSDVLEPDKPVNWQVIIGEGLLCEFGNEGCEIAAPLAEVKQEGFDSFKRVGGCVYWRECKPLEHQSVKVPTGTDYDDESERLDKVLSEAGFDCKVFMIKNCDLIVVQIHGPLDGFTYDVAGES